MLYGRRLQKSGVEIVIRYQTTAKGGTPAMDQNIINLTSALLERGDFFGALALVGNSDHPHALALKGIALAQMGDYPDALTNLHQAAGKFAETKDSFWIVKVRGAIAEILLAQRDFEAALNQLDPGALAAIGDLQSAEYISLQKARLLNLLGRPTEASNILQATKRNPYSALAEAELLALSGKFTEARNLLKQHRSDNPLFNREMQVFAGELEKPEFTLTKGASSSSISLIDYEVMEIPCINLISATYRKIDLLKRPVTAELLTALTQGPVSAKTVFGRTSESLENRLRTEISRIRSDLLLPVAHSKEGYSIKNILLITGPYLAVEALMTDGAHWTTASLAMVFGKSMRTIQRSLAESEQAVGARVGRQTTYSLLDNRCSRASQLMVLAERRDIKSI